MFNQDLKDGKVWEHLVCDYIKKKYPSAEVVDGEHKEGDVFIMEIPLWIEVKFDRLVNKTGDFFIECSCKGEDSGIVTTKSDWWVLCDGVYGYVIPTEILRKMLGRKIRTNDVEGYLIPADRISYSPYVTTWELSIDNSSK